MVSPERERKRRQQGRGRAAWALGLALLFHALTAVLLAVWSALFPPPAPSFHPQPQAVALRQVSSDEWDKNRRVTDSAAASDAAPETVKRKEPEKNPKGQVVDVAPGNDQESDDAKYLAPTANKVAKETRAREQTPFYRNAMPQSTRQGPKNDEGHDAVSEATSGGTGGDGQDQSPPHALQRRAAAELPSTTRRDELKLKAEDRGPGPGERVANRAASEEVEGNSDRLHVAPGSQEGGEEDPSRGAAGPPGVVNLTPSAGVLDRIAGGAPNDHLDAEEGESTFLNTKKWRYASFFNRVKQSVGMKWDPGVLLRERDPTGRIYGQRDRETLLSVTLDDQGVLRDVAVEKSCGVDFLDLEAVHSFERAQPFPNPPPGLVDADSRVRFSFGFFLDMSGPTLRLFRRAN